MEKKIYEKPAMQMELFVPNHYAAACPAVTKWQAKCRTVSCLIFFDDADGNYSSDACRGGCGQTHTFEIKQGESLPTANCWLLLNVRTTGNGTHNAWNSEYNDWFSQKGDSNGVGWILNPDKIAELKASGQLVRGYYNDHVLEQSWGHQPWLVTDDLWSIKPHS